MNMKTNYLKLNSWAVAALMGMCSVVGDHLFAVAVSAAFAAVVVTTSCK